MLRPVLLPILFAGAAFAPLAARPAAQSFSIEHVNVVDVASGAIRADQTVVISNGKITAVGPASNQASHDGARVLNAAGEYLIPGLWDMHVHLRSDLTMPETPLIAANETMLDLFLPNGVVGICEMGGDLADSVVRWRDEIRAGKREGPRILTAGRKIDNDPPAWPGSIGVKTADEARQAVDLNHQIGVDFIKIYFRNTAPEVLRAVVDEAHKFHLKVTGHKPSNMSIQQLIETGVDGIQHAEYLPVTDREAFDTLQRERVRRASTPWSMDATEFNSRFFALENAAEATRVYQLMASKRFWVTPTLSIETHVLEHGVRDYEKDERKRFFPAAIWRTWNAATSSRRPLEGRALALRQAMMKRWQQDALTAFKAGVPMTLGTDCGANNDHQMPGWSTHEELESLVQAGLTPAEALRLATLNAAMWRGDSDEGEIATGKVADLVLLRANPLTDIRHTRQIESVFQSGRYYSRDSLDAMLARAAERARDGH